MKRYTKLFEEFNADTTEVWATLYWNNTVVGGIYPTERLAERAQDAQLTDIWAVLRRAGETRLDFDQWKEQTENDWASADDVRIESFRIPEQANDLLRTVADSVPVQHTETFRSDRHDSFQETSSMVLDLIQMGADITSGFDSPEDLFEFFDGDLSWVPQDALPRKWQRKLGMKGMFEARLNQPKENPAALGKKLLSLLYKSRRFPDSAHGPCKDLINLGADLNVKNPKDGHTPLHRAIEYGHNLTAVELIRAGANPNEPTIGGWMPLHLAVRKRRYPVVSALIAAGAMVNAHDNAQGYTPLHWAAEDAGWTREKDQEMKMAFDLIDARADVNLKDRYGVTPLHIAARNGNTALVKRLVEEGADLEAVNGNLNPDFRLTPLGWAAKVYRYPNTARYLIEAGAVLNPTFGSEQELREFFGGDISWIAPERLRKLKRMDSMRGMFDRG
jgi:ankyrin repeat protein